MLSDQMRILPLPDEVKQYEQLIKQSHKSLGQYMVLKSQIEGTPNLSGFKEHLLRLLDEKFSN